MDNSKRNVHSSGPLGMLLKSGEIKRVDDSEELTSPPQPTGNLLKQNRSYFKTESGIEFDENELVYLDPKECEPWQYANRQASELGNLDELIESIKLNSQLQPALVRSHPMPHDGIRYEVIFGRRRHLACLKLGVPFLAIRKEISNIQDAVATQDAENKFRNDVSNYSNAILYNRLLKDNVFSTEKELAEKLRISTSSLSELMSYTKIPIDIINEIPDIHGLSKSFAQKLSTLSKKSKQHYKRILELAPKIGTTISSPSKLEKLVEPSQNALSKQSTKSESVAYTLSNGKRLFTLKYDQRGAPSIVFKKDMIHGINFEKLCSSIKSELEKELQK